MSILAVYLPTVAADVALAYDYTLISADQALTDHACVHPSMLPVLARGGEVVAVVPVTLLSWHSVQLPKGIRAGSTRLLPVLEGLLEDHLLDDAAHMHLALGPMASADGGQVWVAACEKSWLRGHLKALETAARTVSRIVPEFAPGAGVLRVNVISDAVQPQLIMTGGGNAGVMHLPLTPAALALIPDAVDDEEILIFAEPEVAELAEQLLQRKVELTTRPQRWLEAAQSPWDLAQFELASSNRSRTLKRLGGFGREILYAPAGRPVRWGLALLLMVHLAGINIWSWRLQDSLKTRRVAIATTLTQTFPQVRLVVDAPLQMERELVMLRQASGQLSGRDLETILATLGSVTTADLSPAAIEFTAGEVRLKGVQLGAAEATEIFQQLQRLGYAARLDGDTFFIQHVVPAGGT